MLWSRIGYFQGSSFLFGSSNRWFSCQLGLMIFLRTWGIESLTVTLLPQTTAFLLPQTTCWRPSGLFISLVRFRPGQGDLAVDSRPDLVEFFDLVELLDRAEDPDRAAILSSSSTAAEVPCDSWLDCTGCNKIHLALASSLSLSLSLSLVERERDRVD